MANTQLLSLILRLMEKSNFFIALNGRSTFNAKNTIGVKLGGPLSPLLYSIYVDYMLTEIYNMDIGYKIGNIVNNNNT